MTSIFLALSGLEVDGLAANRIRDLAALDYFVTQDVGAGTGELAFELDPTMDLATEVVRALHVCLRASVEVTAVHAPANEGAPNTPEALSEAAVARLRNELLGVALDKWFAEVGSPTDEEMQWAEEALGLSDRGPSSTEIH
jgi:hypothetical protein